MSQHETVKESEGRVTCRLRRNKSDIRNKKGRQTKTKRETGIPKKSQPEREKKY